MIHDVPRKQGFSSIYTFSCWPIFSVLLFNFPVTVPKAPLTTGINSTFFYFHIQPTSYFSSSYLFCFLSFFFHTRVWNGLNGSIMLHLPFSPLQLLYLARCSPTSYLFLWESPTKCCTFLVQVPLQITDLCSHHLLDFSNHHFLQNF